MRRILEMREKAIQMCSFEFVQIFEEGTFDVDDLKQRFPEDFSKLEEIMDKYGFEINDLLDPGEIDEFEDIEGVLPPELSVYF